MQILVVCTDSIYRSPIGEIVLRDYLGHEGLNEPMVTVASAGTSDEEHGHGSGRRATQILRETGYSLPRECFAHCATAAELRKPGLILAIIVGHARLLRGILEAADEDARKLHLWRRLDGTVPFTPGGVFGEGEVLPAPHEPDENPTQRPKRKHYSDQYNSDGDHDVPDPWYVDLDGFYDTLAVVEAGATGIVRYLHRH